jgi:uncharacterized membrane protein YebE (DUF533 family)
MTSIGPVEQAMLLLKERLRRLGEQPGTANKREAASADPLAPVRALARHPRKADDEVRKALVRALLADALGPGLATSLEFQKIADKVARMLEESDVGQRLLSDAVRELD